MKRPILIQGAMIVEVKKIIDSLENLSEETIGCWTFYKGEIKGYPVIVSKTEMGMTNASAATVLGIEKYNPIAIINQGTAGAHDKSLNKYDIVIGDNTVNIGAYRSDFKEEGLGVDATQWIPIKISVVVDGRVKRVSSFKSDEKLVKVAEKCKTSYTKGKVVTGTLASADEWNKELDRLTLLNSKMKTLAEDMESASCSQIAMIYKVPFLGIRIISNNEHHREVFAKDSTDYCQDFVINVVKSLIDNI